MSLYKFHFASVVEKSFICLCVTRPNTDEFRAYPRSLIRHKIFTKDTTLHTPAKTYACHPPRQQVCAQKKFGGSEKIFRGSEFFFGGSEFFLGPTSFSPKSGPDVFGPTRGTKKD